MTEAQRRQYSQKNYRRMKLFERDYLRGMYDMLQAEFVKAGKAYKSGKIGAYLSRADVMEGAWGYLEKMYQRVGLFYGNKTYQEINRMAAEKKAIGFGFDQQWIDQIKEFFRLYLLNQVVLPISATTKNDIQAILMKGVQEGWGIDQMVFELEHSDIPLWRARMIIRTELLKAQHLGQQLGEEESEWETQKEWIARIDGRERNSHHRADGQTRRSGDKFAVAKRKGGYDMMEGPGDPTASAENVINCRCTVAISPLRDKNGRLIRKRKISVLLPSEVRQTRRQVITI